MDMKIPNSNRTCLLTKLAAVILSIALLASCGGDSTTAGPAVEEDPNAPKSLTDPALMTSPLYTFLGFDASAGQEAVMMERQREGERIIAECMAREGFEYTPHNYEGQSFWSENDEQYKPWSTEWVGKYGLGISTQRFGQSQVGPNLVGYNDDFFNEVQPTPDANAAYQESLSESEREAYAAALYGAPSQDSENMSYEPQGCQGEGFDAMFGDMFKRFEEFNSEFSTIFEDLEERYEADERVAKWKKDVSACMSDKGHAYTDLAATRVQIDSRLSEIQEGTSATQLPENFDDLSEREQREAINASRKLAPAQLDILAEVQNDEIALAKDLVACGGGELNKAIFAKPIQTELENKFLEENRDSLSKFENLFGG